MKPRSSCETCRQRRRKCVVPPGASRCNGCEEVGKPCQFTPKYRFRHTKAAQYGTPNSTISGSEADEIVVTSYAPTPPSTRHAPITPSEDDTESGLASRNTVAEILNPSDSDLEKTEDRCIIDTFFPSLRPPQANTVTSIAYLLDSAPIDPQEPPVRQTECSHAGSTSGPSQKPLFSTRLTGREAYLMRLYTSKLAPCSDACDEARHFGLAIPRLALTEPIILYGILALASRYDAFKDDGQAKSEDLESTYYHNRCIELLIRALAQPPEMYNPTILTAVVIARLYEEFDVDTDSQQYHLTGTRSLLQHETVAHFINQCDLAEAVSWVYLRQAIYVCIVRKQPMDIPLEIFETFSAFRIDDDSSHANRVIYIFAKILRVFFSPASQPGSGSDLDSYREWDALERDLNHWYDSKPLSFEPPYGEDPDFEDGRPFPFMWMISSVPVVALQHYYAARILIYLHQCDEASSKVGFEAARKRRNNERAISSCLCILMGLSLANEQVLNAFYVPTHMLSLCGFYIRHPLERTQTIEFLKRVQKAVRWKPGTLIASLKKQWAELDGSEP